MGDGFFAGGVAQGLQSLPQNIQRGAQLGQQERAQTFREQQAQEAQVRTATQDADKAVSDAVSFTTNLITQLKQAGKTPEEIKAAIEPVVAQTESTIQAQGGDASALRPRITALAETPIPTDDAPGVAAPGAAPAPAQTEQVSQIEGLAQTAGVELPPVVADVNQLKTPVQKELFKAQDKARTTAQLLTELQIFKDLVTNAQTGQITSVTLPIRQFFREAGIVVDENVPVQEAIQAAQNQLALRLRNPDSGFGLTGNTSDRDVKFLKDAVGGLQNTPEGNQAAVIIQMAKQRREAELAALRANLLERGAPQLFGALSKEFINQTPIFTPDEENFLLSLKERASGDGDEGFVEIDGVSIRRVR